MYPQTELHKFLILLFEQCNILSKNPRLDYDCNAIVY